MTYDRGVALIALTREVPERIGDCELTHVARVSIDRDRAAAQHAVYERALRAAGCTVVRLPPAPDLPDSVFVEDAAVVFDELAIVARPGAASRRAEVPAVADALSRYRELRYIEVPATLDGGDVLRAGRHLFVGSSSRSNSAAAGQLRKLLRPFGYAVVAVETRGCLHLKCAVTALADDSLIVNPAWIDTRVFDGFRLVEIDPAEPSAANVLRVGDTVLCAAAHPATGARLQARGFKVASIDLSELAKAEGALTCCSIIVNVIG
jgi:dimethylargininase